MPDVVTLGETMVVFDGMKHGPLRYVDNYERHTGGAETNVAVGLVRLGHTAGWISRVGKDEFGKYILSFYRGEGVDMSQVIVDPDNPTGIFFRQRLENGESKNFYYRKGSAASFLSPNDLNEEYISHAKFLHVTGITPALSGTCHDTIIHAMQIARKNGVKVSYDPNIRMKLWPSKEKAINTLLSLMQYADIILPGLEECQVLFDTDNINEIISQIESYGVETVVIKLGDNGAVAKRGDEFVEVPGINVPIVVDAFGAGDAFCAGFLAGQLKGYNLKETLDLANTTGAISVTIKGNVEALPTLQEVELFLNGNAEANR
jgi:2-dehydro-3-deoxygluconokinase